MDHQEPHLCGLKPEDIDDLLNFNEFLEDPAATEEENRNSSINCENGTENSINRSISNNTSTSYSHIFNHIKASDLELENLRPTLQEEDVQHNLLNMNRNRKNSRSSEHNSEKSERSERSEKSDKNSHISNNSSSLGSMMVSYNGCSPNYSTTSGIECSQSSHSPGSSGHHSTMMMSPSSGYPGMAPASNFSQVSSYSNCENGNNNLMETSQHIVCYQQQPFATSADNLPGNFEQTSFQTDNHPYQTNVLPVNPIPSTFQSADNILGPIDPKIASKIKPQTLPKIIRGKRGRPKGSTKKRLEAEKERIKSDSNSNNSSDSGQYQHQCGGSPDFSIIEPKNMAGNFINPINIHEIDPTKPLKVNSRLELQRLMARKIVVIKKDEKTGQEFHELNIEELKRQQRLQKNRISASESRRRQRDYIKLLEEKVQMLEMENKQLKDKLYWLGFIFKFERNNF